MDEKSDASKSTDDSQTLDLDAENDLKQNEAKVFKEDFQTLGKSKKEHLNTLRANLSNSSAFLENLKKDITNLKLLINEDSANNLNSSLYREYCDKTNEELDDEMERVRNKLAQLHERLMVVKAGLMENASGDNTV